MATTTDPKRTQNSNTTIEENGTARVVEEEHGVGVKFEDKVDTIDKTDNENNVHGEKESDESSMAVSRDGKKVVLGMDGDNEEGLEENSSEDNEVEEEEPSDDDEENFEDNSEEDNEEIVGMDGISEEETSGDSDDKEDEVSDEGEKEEEGDEQNMQEGKDFGEEDGQVAETKKVGMGARGRNTEKKEVTPRNTNDSNKRSRDKLLLQGTKKEDSKDKLEASHSKRPKKKVETMGMVFMCSSKTKNDCYQYKVFGLPESKKDIVEKIYTGMRLFLYDVDLKLMYGVYKAAGPGGYNIQPKAFKSQFPAQVRFKVLRDCLPLAEEKFRKVIKDNYFTKSKFDCCLNSGQVKKLCELFLSSSKGPRSKKFRSRRVEKRLPVRRERQPRRRRVDDDRGTVLKEERRHIERPRKRQREIFSSVAPLRQTPKRTSLPYAAYGMPSDVDAYRLNPYVRSRSPYRERRDPSDVDAFMQAPYARTRSRSPYKERREPYSDERGLYAVRGYRYKDAGDSFIPRHDPPYRDGPERIVRFREERDAYPEHRDRYRDAAPVAAYTEIRDSYRSGQNLHLGAVGLYRDTIVPDSYSTRIREPILERDDAYRKTRGVEYVDSYRRQEVLDRRDPRPSDLMAVHDVVPSSSYLTYRERPSYAGSIYSAEYLPRTGLTREYRL